MARRSRGIIELAEHAARSSALLLNRCACTYLLLLFAAFVVYGNSVSGSFHYDDAHSIVQNSHIRSLDLIGSFYLDSSTFSNEPTMAMYRPLTQTSFALNYALGGYDVEGYHVFNILLHALCSCAVFSIVRALAIGPFTATVAALLFLVHPIHSQAVNYISARSSLIAGMAALSALVLALAHRRRSFMALALGSGLAAKSAAIVAAPIALLWDLCRRDRPIQWRTHLVLAAVTLGYVAVISLDGFLPRSLAQEVRSLNVQVATQIKAVPYYLKLIIMPVSLSVEHSFSEAAGIADTAVAAALLLCLSVVAGAFAIRSQAPRVVFGLGWFTICLSLTFFVPLNVLVSEHRLYLASVGLLICLAVLWDSGRTRQEARLGVMGCRRGVAAFIAVVFLALLTVARNDVWRSELSLWSDAAAKGSGMFRAQSNLGLAMLQEGDYSGARKRLERAVELNPRYGKTWSNLGLTYRKLGREEEARRAFERALHLRPGLVGTLNNLALLHVDGGRIERGKRYLLQAIAINPSSLEARVNLGRIYQQQGNWTSARAEYDRALAIDPRFAPAANNLGLMLWEREDLGGASFWLTRAAEIDPRNEEIQINAIMLDAASSGKSQSEIYEAALVRYAGNAELWRAVAEHAMRQRRWQRAIEAWEQHLELQPGSVLVYTYLADAYLHAGRAADAVVGYRRAIDLDPRNANTFNNLASAHAELGHLDSALIFCRRGLAIDPENDKLKANLVVLGAVTASAK